MEALQGAELTGTNRSCGLAISSKASIEFDARSSGDDDASHPQGRAGALSTEHGARIAHGARTRRVLGCPTDSGGNIEEAIPDPISNSVVKLLGADGTARATVWESRTLPG